LSSNAGNQLLENVLEELARHKKIYKTAEIRATIAKREDIPSRKGKWHNCITLIKFLPGGRPSSWRTLLEKDNLLISSAVITIDKFKKILNRLVSEEVIEIDDHEAHGPFHFHQREFIDSVNASLLYNANYAVNLWRIEDKEKLGLPSASSLRLESEKIPFKGTSDAIRYHLDLTHEGYSRMKDSINIVTPLAYGKIGKVHLDGQELCVETTNQLASLQGVEIKFNTEALEEGKRYYSVLEAGTSKLSENVTKIRLKSEPGVATIWLHHKKGFVIDYRRIWRTPSIEAVERDLSKGGEYFSQEGVNVITQTIDHRSKEEFSIATTEEGVDSIDVEILKAIKEIGGDYADFMPEVLKYLSLDLLLSRLARLRGLGFLALYPPRRILLTSPGVDALNLPPSVLSARIPAEFGRRIAEIKLAFRNGNFDEVTNKATKLLEAVLRRKLEEKFRGTIRNIWPNLKLGSYDRASLGTLKEACLKLKVLKRNGIVDHILSTLLKLRVPITHEKETHISEQDVALQTIRLIEVFVRQWYYLQP